MTDARPRGDVARRLPIPPLAPGSCRAVVVSDLTAGPPLKRMRLPVQATVSRPAAGHTPRDVVHTIALSDTLCRNVLCRNVFAIKALPKIKNKININIGVGMSSLRKKTSGFSNAVRRDQFPVPSAPVSTGTLVTSRTGHAQIFSGPGDSTPTMDAPMAMENPLARHRTQWELCGASPWVLRTITKGYRLQFAMRPPAFSEVLFSEARGPAAEVLQTEIQSLLEKKAIVEVPVTKSRSGFYSRYFLVKKKGGGLRPILDLRALNRYLKTFNFKMLTAKSLVRSIRPNDWFTSIDLKDAYFHIPIYPPHRKFLRFGFRGKLYEYTVLPFGMSLSPRVFVKCTEAAIAPLRRRGLRVASYIDDWLLSADSAQEAVRHTNQVVLHMTSLGFTINHKKSVMVPTRSIDFIGIALDSVSYTARLSQERIDAFLRCVALFRTGLRVPFRTCLRMAGLMASAISLVRLGRLHMRPFQRWVASLGVPTRCLSRRVTVSAGCVLALKWWSSRRVLEQGVPLGLTLSRKVVTTDASLSGWGATHDGRTARGVWCGAMRHAHINYLELLAVFLALRHFKPFIQGCHVLVRTDNTTTMCYINKQGGLKSLRLHMLAHRLLIWCEEHLLSITACHVPGLLNTGADLLSRGQLRYHDWSLHGEVAAQIWARYGTPVVDLFASEENTKCQYFFSLTGSSTLGVDALAHPWPRGLLYAFPPLPLIPPTLARVRNQGLRLLLVAPAWGSWRSDVVPLLYDQPWQLPLRRDLLTQAGQEIFHPRPQDLDLWVWPVKG